MITTTELEQLETRADIDGIQRLVVGAVIRDGNQVLLLQRPVDDFMGGIHELPSGKVELGESLDDALVREVAEETGLTVTGLTRYISSFDYTSGSGKQTRQLNFEVEVTATSPVTLTEHVGYQWAELDGELQVTDAVRDILRQLDTASR